MEIFFRSQQQQSAKKNVVKRQTKWAKLYQQNWTNERRPKRTFFDFDDAKTKWRNVDLFDVCAFFLLLFIHVYFRWSTFFVVVGSSMPPPSPPPPSLLPEWFWCRLRCDRHSMWMCVAISCMGERTRRVFCALNAPNENNGKTRHTNLGAIRSLYQRKMVYFMRAQYIRIFIFFSFVHSPSTQSGGSASYLTFAISINVCVSLL